MLSEAQRGDPELKSLFARAVDLNESEKLSHQNDDICTLLSTYEQIFGDVPQPCRGVEHDILLTDNAMPVKQHPYREDDSESAKQRGRRAEEKQRCQLLQDLLSVSDTS
ncbi:hypothetical protein Pcinc_029102 [Petrolisthes cinctipes]|uniref:Uncharacterized protein n=1 Tax=Petrolisthes cinctipes TaxID=88211 RepID=A0AAE1K815_PETCI|nr:hypothetical protein Pcinc_029102 [Petrolisthes cinctipes]